MTLTLWLAVYGADYYKLGPLQRVASPKHALLRSSGTIGLHLGMLGGVLFVVIFLYPLRKRWRWLQRKGKTRHWFDFHVVAGLTAPVVITFHSSFKLNGVAGLAYWIMMSVVVSGVVGRYFYAQIPRRLDAAEMSLQEMQALSAQLAGELQSQHAVAAEIVQPLLKLPALEEVERFGLLRVVGLMVLLDLRRWLLSWNLGRRCGIVALRSMELQHVIATVNQQAALSKKILFLSKTHQIFHLWHIVHRPFSYSFAILAFLHVLIVVLFGFW